MKPMAKDVSTFTTIEIFAALELPFATRTLQMRKDKVNIPYGKQTNEKLVGLYLRSALLAPPFIAPRVLCLKGVGACLDQSSCPNNPIFTDNKKNDYNKRKLNECHYLAAAMKPSDIINSHPFMLRL